MMGSAWDIEMRSANLELHGPGELQRVQRCDELRSGTFLTAVGGIL